MDTLIVGAGAVGRWFAHRLDWPVAFTDVDRSAARDAAEALGERGRSVPVDTVASFDVVVVAVPMRVATEVIQEHGPRAETALLDLTGEMVAPLDAMAAAAPHAERASLHTLFAPEHAPGRIAVSVGDGGPTIERIRNRLAADGNEIVEVDPAVHDEAMVTIQGRAHAAVLAFGLAAESVPDELATPVFEQLQALRERVTEGQPGVYADIQATFDGARDIETAASKLAEADTTEFEALYDDAG